MNGYPSYVDLGIEYIYEGSGYTTAVIEWEGGYQYLGQVSRTALWATYPPPPSPWVIAVAPSTVVPEPSTLTIAGLAGVCGIAYGLARKRRALSKPRNEQ